jgi:hypothetical protein
MERILPRVGNLVQAVGAPGVDSYSLVLDGLGHYSRLLARWLTQ